VKYAFIESDLAAYDVTVSCAVLQVSRSGYYQWRERPASSRALAAEALAVEIQSVYAENHGVYGSPRIYQVLKAQGHQVCENTVAKVMRRHEIRAKTKQKYVPRTTDSSHDQPLAKNVLNRGFAAELPNQKWAVDITYIPTDEGWLYLAGVMDLCSRKIVGWSMREHLQAELATEALTMAIIHRRPKAGLLHHSDRGVQYASEEYRHLLEQHAMEASMSGRGDCWDNACVESFWGTLKTEWVHHLHYTTRQQARQSLFEYIEVFYNRKRLHSSLGYLSPEAFEARLN
jgi:transposase InsO family protein